MLLPTDIVIKKKKKKCCVDSCEKVVKAKEMCDNHYEIERRKLKGKCSVDGCNRKEVRNNLCERHNGERTNKLCIIDGCNGFVHASDFCKKHYLRKFRNGDPNIIHRGEIGAGTINQFGYRVLYKPGHQYSTKTGTVLEHRFIMAIFLERPLRKNENVHHRNGNKLDNRIENLELWARQQPVGQRVSDIYLWAKSIIEKYEQEYKEKLQQFDDETQTKNSV